MQISIFISIKKVITVKLGGYYVRFTNDAASAGCTLVCTTHALAYSKRECVWVPKFINTGNERISFIHLLTLQENLHETRLRIHLQNSE